MKLRIERHEEGLKNSRATRDRKFLEYIRLKEEIEKMDEEHIFRQKQIETAIAKGLREFDGDKFLVQKKSKGSNQ